MPPTPACPRCGYDLSGQVAPWGGRVLEKDDEPRRHEGHEAGAREVGDGAACPVVGTCSECGLEFLWRDLLVPRFQKVKGFYEHARSAWNFSALTRTRTWCLIPWVFWGIVKLHHEVRWKRVAWAAVITLLTLHMLHGAVEAARIAGMGLGQAQYSRVFRNYGRGSSALTVPREFVLCRGFVWPLLDIGFDPGPQWNWSPGNTAVMPVTVRIGRTWPILVAFPTLVLAYPLCFGVLPFTRRMAKLRAEHVLRATAWSAFAWTPAITAWVVVYAVTSLDEYLNNTFGVGGGGYFLSRDATRALDTTVFILFRVSTAWILLWWLAAITKGWKLHRGVLLWLGLTVIAGLASTLTAVLLGLLMQAFR